MNRSLLSIPTLSSFVLAACMLVPAAVHAQDPNLAMPYASPVLVNPSFTGLVEGKAGFSMSHRVRRGTINATSNTTVFQADLPINKKWYQGGAGLVIMTDNYGGLRRNSALLGLSWEAPLGAKTRYTHIRASVQAGVTQSSVADPLYVFEDMYNATLGEFSGNTTESIFGLSSQVKLDASAGILVYRTQKIKGNPEFNWFFGGSVYHLNQANMGLLPSDNIPRPIRYVGMGGIKYRTRSSFDLNLNLLYQQQNNSSQITYGTFIRTLFFDKGILFGAESAAITVGANVRQQLNTVNIDGTTQRQTGLESVTPYIGIDYGRQFRFGFAFELIINKNTTLDSQNGGMQFSVGYLIDGAKYKKPALPFPSF